MKFFKSEADRNLWLKLNAEYQIEGDKRSDCSNALHPRTMEEALQVAKNQLEYDESVGKLRVTLEEYLTLEYSDIRKIRKRGIVEMFQKAMFNK